MRGRSYQRNPKAYPDGFLPPIAEKNGQQAESQTGDAPGPDGDRMNLKQLYKSNSYKNMQQEYIYGKGRRGRGGALAHLEQVDGPGAMRRGGPRDYLNEIRDKRVARETKMSNARRVRQLINNEKLSNLEKLNMVKTKADQIEQDALQREHQRTVDQRVRAHAEDQDDALKRKDRIQQDFESVDEVNQLMLDAIKAKLAILDH